MGAVTGSSVALRALIDTHRDELAEVLAKYGAANPRLFGSVARGDAVETSDIDILVDLIPDDRDSDLFRLGGLTEGFERVLGCQVDVVAPRMLREGVSAAAERDVVPL